MNFYFDLIKTFFQKYAFKIVVLLIALSILSLNIFHIFFQNSLNTDNNILNNNNTLSLKDDQISENDISMIEAKDQDNKAEETTKYFIDIKGYVKKPGVYEVDTSSIVNDCIKLAGGLLKNADTTTINLSKKVTSEMVIYIPKKNEVIKSTTNTTITDNKEIPNNAAIADNSNDNNNVDEKTPVLININTATKEELTTLTGIGAAKAEDIINYRNTNGNFKTIDDLKNVSGIGENLFAKIKDSITV